MTPEDLLAQLRTAFASDLAEAVGVLEQGLVALEREPAGEALEARLRDVFRAAHGLKGSARAAGLPAIEGACHAMESLLGAARDQGRVLGPDDFAALLAAVDALSGAHQRLAEAPTAEVDAAPFAASRERLEKVLGGPPSDGAEKPSASAAGERGSREAARGSRIAAAAPTSTSTSNPTSTSTSASPTPDDARRPRRSNVRLPAERLDALAVAGAALVMAAHQAQAGAARLDDLAREARRLRIRARSEAHDAGAGRLEDDLRRHERTLAAVRAQALQDARALEQRIRRLAADIRALRLTPFPEATAGLGRAAREIAAKRGTEVELAVEGEPLELDRAVVDALREPLGQLVSNAVAHAIEPPDERLAAGKPARGRIVVAARVEGERLHVTVSDDGRGLDPDRLREAARRRGLSVPTDGRRALELVFAPGFSTAEAVTEVAGRGVGLDVVAAAVRARRGSVSVTSVPGCGTTFTLWLPATLYGLRAVVARDGGQLYALPALDVERVVRVTPEGVGRMDGRAVLLGPDPLPLAPLGHAAGLESGAWRIEDRRTAVVVAAAGRRAAFAVEEVLAERELSLEPVPRRAELPVASAVSVLPGGGLALVLAADALVEAAGGAALPAAPAPAEARRPRILLADDAATTRALARSILEAAGYEVLAAADGEQAFAMLQQHGADAVVSDVEMPGMNGFELTRAVRGSARFERLPVVLLTALAADADRRRGLDAGASAYLVKSAFDQRQLLDTLAELLGALR